MPDTLPPLASQLRALADACVMCGLCLPFCPTFALHRNESHSPRGRIALAKELTAEAPVDASVREALESCLQCRACESVCPAQVRYGAIIEAARALLTADGAAALPWVRRAARNPRATAIALALAGRVARWWPALTRRVGRPARYALRAHRAISRRAVRSAATVLFVGCVARVMESEAQLALLHVATRLALDVQTLAEPGCCGALARHLGATSEANQQLRRNQLSFAQAKVRQIIALDSGCIGALRQASGSAEVIEGCRWLMQHQARWQGQLRHQAQRVGWFSPCSHRHSAGDAHAPAQLLAALPGVEVVPISAGFGCCGAAGPHVLAHTDQADALVQPIIDALLSMSLDAIATTNVGCAMHLAERLSLRGITLTVRHPVAFLLDRLPREP